jgi:sensor histidine kinase YesM
MRFQNAHIGFDDRLFTLLGIPLLGMLIPVVFGGIGIKAGQLYWVSAAISGGYTAIYWFTARALMIRLHRIYPEADQLGLRVRWLAILFVPFIVAICGLSYVLIPSDYSGGSDFLQSVLMSTILTVSVAGIYESVYLLHRFREVQLEREQLLRERVQTELEALRNQVNPHFLFNSLNTLADLISEDPLRAEQYVQELSKVYRYVLEIQTRELIPMQEELDFLHSYLYLLRTRFGDKIQVHFAIPESLHSRHIVPLSLQLLFENAIKHNVVSEARPLHIEVFSENGADLMVRNNLQPRQLPAGSQDPSTKKGLDNLRNRYRLLANRMVETVATASSFTVVVPTLAPADSASPNLAR